MGAILGCTAVFKALAGSCPWGAGGLALCKPFLKLLLPRRWRLRLVMFLTFPSRPMAL